MLFLELDHGLEFSRVKFMANSSFLQILQPYSYSFISVSFQGIMLHLNSKHDVYLINNSFGFI